MNNYDQIYIAENVEDILPDQYKVYVQPGVYAMSSRKIEALIKIAKLQQFYLCNPVRFIKDFFSIELIDAQALIIQRSWNCPNVLVVATRGLGKSTIIDLEIMSKQMLTCNYWSYIASGSGSQAEQTFTTLERLANDNIDTMMGSTGEVFKNEIVINNSSGDGFNHSAKGFTYSLHNGSMTRTLNSNVDNARGMRGSVVFDECGFLSSEMIKVYGAFAIVNKSFLSGKDRDGNTLDPIRIRSFPGGIPNQKFYISSASSTDTEFYRLYRDFAKRQIMGDPDFCVLHVDCDVAFAPTINGRTVSPLLQKSIVESELQTNPEKARREYYCEFTTDAGEDAVIKRSVILRNSEVRIPDMFNPGGKKYIISYDPARSRDNSVITIAEVYFDERAKQYKGKIVNSINMIDISKKLKTPMQTPEQIEYLKEVILAYNGNAEDYENIVGVYIDAGAGGGGVNIADFLMPNWKDKKGNWHKGLIDKDYSNEYVKKFPEAINKLKLMSPVAMKSVMYESLIEMCNQNLISFTADYDSRGYLNISKIDPVIEKKEKDRIISRLKKENVPADQIEQKAIEELMDMDVVETKLVKLDPEQEISLSNMDALKEELVNIVRIKRDSGKDSFELCNEKRTKLHDDRAYTMCMIGYGLHQLRRKEFMKKENPKTERIKIGYVRKPKRVTRYS